MTTASPGPSPVAPPARELSVPGRGRTVQQGVGNIKLHGTVENNLRAALVSARRLRGHPVHPDTIRYWSELLDYARRKARSGNQPAAAIVLLKELSLELAEHFSGQVAGIHRTSGTAEVEANMHDE